MSVLTHTVLLNSESFTLSTWNRRHYYFTDVTLALFSTNCHRKGRRLRKNPIERNDLLNLSHQIQYLHENKGYQLDSLVFGE